MGGQVSKIRLKFLIIIKQNAFADPRNKPLNQKLQTHIEKYNSKTTLTTANSVPSFNAKSEVESRNSVCKR